MNVKALVMNKQIMLALGMIVFIGAVVASGTGAFFSDSAQATGNVFAAGTLDLKIAKDSNGTPVNGWLDAQIQPWNLTNLTPGGTPEESTVWLKNEGSVDGMSLGVALDNASATVPNTARQMRITKMTLGGNSLLQGGAGASIGEYVTPTSCDATVTPGSLVSVVAAATAGQTICVEAGTYTPGTLALNTAGVTLVAVNAPTSGDKARIEGAISIGANNVTVRGFEITNPTGSYAILVNGMDGSQILDNVITGVGSDPSVEGSAQAVYLNGDASVAGFTVKGNQITNVGHTALKQGGGSGSSAKGIYIGDTTGNGVINGVVIENNVISDVKASTAPWVNIAADNGRGAYGFLVNYGAGGANTGDTSVVVKNNTITDLEGLWSHAVGLEANTPNASVTYNDISDIIDHKSPSDTDAVGVMIEDNDDYASVVINNNNFTNVLLGIRNTMGGAVNGQNNWWGDFDPSDNIRGSVNTNGFLGGPVSGLVNGNDANGNGFADLQDLNNDPILNAGVGLDGGEQKPFVLAVQLDGTTTGNEFQGASLTTDIVFTLNQI